MFFSFPFHFQGLEDFENKVDKLTEGGGVDGDENSWINQVEQFDSHSKTFKNKLS